MMKSCNKVRDSRVGFSFFLIFLLLHGVVHLVSAQADGDSTKAFPWKLHFQSRYSLVENHFLSVWGGSVGWIWGPMEHEITVGYHWLGRRGTHQLGRIEREITAATALDTYIRTTHAGFINVGYWHIVKNSRRWKMGFPIEVGVGKATARPYSLLEEPLSADPLRSTILPVQLGTYVEWKATRWIGLGIQGGYRQNLVRFDPVERLNGPYGRLRILVYPATYLEWYRFVFKREPLSSPFYKKEKSTI